jgi:flagellar assembly factor FliW
MLVNTVRFGELEIQPEQVLTFEQGLPGFEQLHAFTLIMPDQEMPFTFLQSLDDGEVAFILTDPFLFYANYEFELSNEVIEHLQVTVPQDVAVWSIVSVTDDIASSTINLLAPVVIHEKAKLGKQIILHGSGYYTKHPLVQQEQSLVTNETAVGKEPSHARTDT